MNLFHPSGKLELRLADPNVDRTNVHVSYLARTGQDKPLHMIFNVRADSDRVVNKYHVVLSFKRHTFVKSQLSKLLVTVTPAFSVRNWLPFPVSIQVDSRDKIAVEAGRVLPLLDSGSNPVVAVTFEIKNAEVVKYKSEKIKIPSEKADKDGVLILIFF